MDGLPIETLLNIFRRLNFRDKYHCTLVRNEWFDILMSHDCLWQARYPKWYMVEPEIMDYMISRNWGFEKSTFHYNIQRYVENGCEMRPRFARCLQMIVFVNKIYIDDIRPEEGFATWTFSNDTDENNK